MAKKNTTCSHCMGPVGPDGLVVLGEAEQFEPFEGESTDQQNATEKMRSDSGFTEAVKRMSRGGYAGGGEVEEAAKGTDTSTETEVRSPTSTSTDAYTQGNITVTGGAGKGSTTVHIGASEDMKRKKQERYGRGRR